MSSTTNSTRSFFVSADLKALVKKSLGCSSAACSVCGSTRWRMLDTLQQMQSCERWPSWTEVCRGSQTRSSRHTGRISTEYVNLFLPLPVCVSSDTSCFECLYRIGETDCRKDTSFSACERWSKKKSRPSFSSMMFVESECAACFRMSCSSHRKVRLCGTFCLIWTIAVHVSFASRRWQLGHCLLPRIYSTTNVCCSTAPATTSFWIVSFSLIRRECGSVQTNDASTSFTSVSPRGLRSSSASSSFDSSSTADHPVSRRS
mmetsp:Transcript_3864/g.11440  ORF Transcript_3864/g.11440 Transcript_3864/m.11440 type:complete len:260 (-) Transcript_3864:226-1005(-)